MTYRRIDPSPFMGFVGAPDRTDLGARPTLRWIAISDLLVDPAYQRDIFRRGARNVGRIAREFDWSKFAPVIVAPVDGGKFAIVDGQHRTTAAAARDVLEVPCQIINVGPQSQAESFAAINGAVTQVTALQIHAAKVHAGDPHAMAIDAACRAAGVTICRYPVPASNMKPGETLAIGAIEKAFRSFGPDLLSRALRCITRCGRDNTGLVKAAAIEALCGVLDAEPGWRDPEVRLLSAMGQFDLGARMESAVADARRRRSTVSAVLMGDLFTFIDQAMKAGA